MKLAFLTNKIKHQRILNLDYLWIFLLIFISCGSQKNLPDDTESLEKLLWSKRADSTILMNKEMLTEIYKITETGEDRHFRFLSYYSSDLTTKKPTTSKELSFSERTYIVAHVLEYMYKCQRKFKQEDPYKDSKFINRLLAPWKASKYNKELKANDYYGLKLLKKHHMEHYFQYPEEDTIPSIKRRSD